MESLNLPTFADVEVELKRREAEKIRQEAWENLCRIEPRLARLARRIKRIRRPFDAYSWWYGYSPKTRWRDTAPNGLPGIKAWVTYLVGWEAENTELRTRRAHHLAYHYLLDLLERQAEE